jgi:putative membrane protein
MQEQFSEADIFAIERPHRSLWKYYLLCCFAIPPLFPFLVLPAWFRFHTMRYKFADDGISMSWGILFRREVIIQYARIQDIHIRSNVVERWLGLARVLVQTASGNAASEMTLEGLREFNAIRDFLYSKMRGVKSHSSSESIAGSGSSSTDDADVAATMREVAEELRKIRLAMESGGAGRGKADNV